MSLSKLTKYCACHEKWISWLILVTHETLFTMRGVTSVIVQTHQILRLPRTMTLMINPLHTWNAIYNARTNTCHCPNSETLFTMRGTTDGILQHHRILRLPRKMTVMTDPHHIWNVIYNARDNRWHPPTSPNSAPATQNDSPKFRANFSKTAETSFPMRDRSEHDPTMIRAWNRQSATCLATEVTFRAHHEHFLLKNTTFRAPAYIQKLTKCCTCHEK